MEEHRRVTREGAGLTQRTIVLYLKSEVNVERGESESGFLFRSRSAVYQLFLR